MPEQILLQFRTNEERSRTILSSLRKSLSDYSKLAVATGTEAKTTVHIEYFGGCFKWTYDMLISFAVYSDFALTHLSN